MAEIHIWLAFYKVWIYTLTQQYLAEQNNTFLFKIMYFWMCFYEGSISFKKIYILGLNVTHYQLYSTLFTCDLVEIFSTPLFPQDI